jgi:hypothetical protein
MLDLVWYGCLLPEWVWGMAITRFPACMLERLPLTPVLLLQVRPCPHILCAAPVFTPLPEDPGPISNPSGLSPDALPTITVIVACTGPLSLIVSLILDRWLLVLYFQGFQHSLDQLLKSERGTVSSTQDRSLGVFQDPDDLESQYRGNCCFRSGIDVHMCFGPLEMTMGPRSTAASTSEARFQQLPRLRSAMKLGPS